ncbi:MAG: peptidoglycan DD-metalloendopeptidase family protein [Gammaproteobacteria bacterium]|jgi:murein hydrolase activator|nr:peptidoglycan DD-metalloendopeptidase family protein [Gammaproteobacteria bacterium]
MTRAYAKLALILFVSAYLLNLPLLNGQEDPSQADLVVLANTISDVQSLIENTRQQRSSVEINLETNEKAINDLNLSISDIQERINNEQTRLANLEQQSVELNTERSNQEVLIGQYFLAAYQNGNQEYLKLLLNQQSISSSARVLRYYQYFNEARTKRITDFQELLTEIESISSELQESNRNLLIQRDNLINQQNNLELRQRERLSLLMELDITLASSTNELSRLEVQYEEMSLLIEELSLAILELSFGSQDEDFLSLRGSLPWPLQGPLLNAYGENYELGDLDWEGVTIAGISGTEVRAIHHGRVIYSDWFSNSGLLLIIDHGDGYMSLYAHNQSLFKEVGEWVTSGEVVTAVGNTGGRNENGVYFEIRYDGEAQDPENWLVRQ